MSPRVSKGLSQAECAGKPSGNGLVTEAHISGYLSSAQLSTAKTTSAHSHEVDHHHSLNAIISILGSTLTTVL